MKNETVQYIIYRYYEFFEKIISFPYNYSEIIRISCDDIPDEKCKDRCGLLSVNQFVGMLDYVIDDTNELENNIKKWRLSCNRERMYYIKCPNVKNTDLFEIHGLIFLINVILIASLTNIGIKRPGLIKQLSKLLFCTSIDLSNDIEICEYLNNFHYTRDFGMRKNNLGELISESLCLMSKIDNEDELNLYGKLSKPLQEQLDVQFDRLCKKKI